MQDEVMNKNGCKYKRMATVPIDYYFFSFKIVLNSNDFSRLSSLKVGYFMTTPTKNFPLFYIPNVLISRTQDEGMNQEGAPTPIQYFFF